MRRASGAAICGALAAWLALGAVAPARGAEFWSPEIEGRFRGLCADAPIAFQASPRDGYGLRCQQLTVLRGWYRIRFLEGAYARLGAVVRREAGRVTSVFYPFGGPDLPTPFAVFPDADRVTALALESVGSPADFRAGSGEQASVFPERAEGVMPPNPLRLALVALLPFYAVGYFTVEEPFPSIPVSHVVLLQAIHDLGGTVDAVRPIRVADDGSVEVAASPAPGLEISFHTAEGRARRYRYFTANLANDHFPAGGALARMVEAEKPDAVLIKAGSNLIVDPGFSNVKALVVGRARAIVEDGELGGEANDPVAGFRRVDVPLGGLGIGYAQHAESNTAFVWVRSPGNEPAGSPR